MEEEPEIHHSVIIKDNWIVDKYGFVDIPFFIDCCLNYRKEAVSKMLFKNRAFPNVCFYPDEVTLDDG